jgi:hypothetical protein
MKNTLLIILLGLFIQHGLQAQNTYSGFSGEIIFSFSDVTKYNDGLPTNLRFTMWFHLGKYYHIDFNDVFGIYTGGAIRNIGLITKDETFAVENDPLKSYKIKRRTYTLGVPLAFKLGSFKDDLYIFGGGEYEWAFHYKQKLFEGNDKISKQTGWFSNRVNTFLPSLFTGVQFPGGFNIKFKYYLTNFLNEDFKGNDFNREVDYAEFDETTVYYISISKHLYNKNKDDQESNVSFTAL